MSGSMHQYAHLAVHATFPPVTSAHLRMLRGCYRLRQAHKCSQISSKPAYARPTDIEAGGGEVATQDDEAAKRIHGQFMQMAMQLIDGRMDSSQYEDSCRQLLGTKPYLQLPHTPSLLTHLQKSNPCN